MLCDVYSALVVTRTLYFLLALFPIASYYITEQCVSCNKNIVFLLALFPIASYYITEQCVSCNENIVFFTGTVSNR